MLISNADALYYNGQRYSKAYAGEDLVFNLSDLLVSKDTVVAGGFVTGNPTVKTVDTAVSRVTNSAYLPGTTNLTGTRQYWPDWGDDIFDGWGFYYLYNPATNQYKNVILPNMQQADGLLDNLSLTEFGGRTFNIKYGYPIQGVFRINVVASDALPFVFGFDGGLGSNATTINTNLFQSYSLGGQEFTLHYTYNLQGENPSEDFYVYFVPYRINQNKSELPYTKYIYNTDNFAVHSKEVTYGINIYIAKQNDVKDWIINDLELIDNVI